MASNGTGNTAPTLTTITILLFIWATVSYGVRSWVKLQKRDHWGLDDASITLAVFAMLGQIIALCYSIHRGYGSPWDAMSPDDKEVVEQSLFASQVLYVASIGFTKMSTGLFTASVLTRDPRNIKIARALVGLCCVWLVASIFTITLRGDLSQPWETLNDTTVWTRWVGIEATGFTMDVFSAALATYLVWSLQMAVKKKLAVFCILNCRLLLALPVAFRLYYLHPSQHNSDYIPADIVTEVIQGTSIVFACITCLKPFLSPFDPVAFNISVPRSGLFRYTAETPSGRGDRYYELSGPRSGTDRKSRTLESTRSIGVDGGQEDELPLTDAITSVPTFRPPGVSHSAQAKSTQWRQSVGAHGNDHSIFKTESYTVSVRDM
ncbi:uncharacterized protein LTR77_007138 [Saxophila tyrrhenica]|uniref:Rhodopsin domain-containing protein n=1 Tax=Saxophila tyrrhenica TaxID=1690608 RepID=A0AAV9P753_9PEZI|nr:hypothetical protein LTR77_007138 [Saxophila tyrrhenica]